MFEALKIRLAARCEAAGRPENEDNFQVAEDLSVSNVGFTTDKVFKLGSKGSLLLVCDGMGGMNAGEVASAIGVETIKNLFAPHLITSEVLANDDSICTYMKRAIVKADSRIKEEASRDEAKHGMGSTIVMAWLLGHKAYVAWCGDSRCYRYNPLSGLEQLSHDHSYVQDLVDTKQLSPELAFEHPNKNIITRSLGDPRGTARPDVKAYELRVGDVILLCSDGLSDSLRDNEIEQSISRSCSSMATCCEALWNDSRQAGWHDNVTIVLAQVVDERVEKAQPHAFPTTAKGQAKPIGSSPVKNASINYKLKFIICVLTVLLGAFVIFFLREPKPGKTEIVNSQEAVDRKGSSDISNNEPKQHNHEMKENNGDHNISSNNNTSKKTDDNTLQQQIQKLKKENKDLKDSISKLNKAIAEASGIVKSKDNKITYYQAKLQDAEAKNKELDKENSSLQRQLDNSRNSQPAQSITTNGEANKNKTKENNPRNANNATQVPH